jgi:hypothetical protein
MATEARCTEMGNTPNQAFSGPISQPTVTANNGYGNGYGDKEARAAEAHKPAQERATRAGEPNPYPPEAEYRQGNFT